MHVLKTNSVLNAIHVHGISCFEFLKEGTTCLSSMDSYFFYQSNRLQLIFYSVVNEQKQFPWAPWGERKFEIILGHLEFLVLHV